MRVDKLRSEYQSLIEEFTRQAKAAGGMVHSSRPSLLSVPGESGEVEVVGIFYLKQWPYSSGSTKPTKKLDILLRSAEVYEQNSLCLRRSTIQVMYYNTSTVEAEPNLGIHYDYEYKMGAAHPIFHAQLGSSSFSMEELAAVKFDRPIQKWKDLVRVRIPTVHIGFPAAILSLFADHLPHDRFDSFLKYAQKQHLFVNAKARVDCRAIPINESDSMVFQAHRLYANELT